MKRDPRLYLEDILQAIAAIERYTEGLSREDFDRDELVQDGVLRRLEVIGEAAGRLPQDLRDRSPEIPWRQIVGMRNRLIHEYFGIILDRAWKVLQEDLAPLKEAVLKLKTELERYNADCRDVR